MRAHGLAALLLLSAAPEEHGQRAQQVDSFISVRTESGGGDSRLTKWKIRGTIQFLADPQMQQLAARGLSEAEITLRRVVRNARGGLDVSDVLDTADVVYTRQSEGFLFQLDDRVPRLVSAIAPGYAPVAVIVEPPGAVLTVYLVPVNRHR